MRRRRFLGHTTFLGLSGAAGTLGLIHRVLAAGANPVAPGIHRITGSVMLNGTPAREGLLVRPGDTLTTGPGAEVIYVIGQDAYLQRERSTVSFAGDAVASVMRVVTGKILSVFGKGYKQLVTPAASIGIRGTGCYIEAEEKRVYFCLCYGAAEIAPVADPSRIERIETRHHDHPVYIHNDDAMPMMANATVINHTDAELTMLEALVGRRPPFHGQGIKYYSETTGPTVRRAERP